MVPGSPFLAMRVSPYHSEPSSNTLNSYNVSIPWHTSVTLMVTFTQVWLMAVVFALKKAEATELGAMNYTTTYALEREK